MKDILTLISYFFLGIAIDIVIASFAHSFWLLQQKTKSKILNLRLKGIVLHHSLLGLLLILIGIFKLGFILIPLGLGIIISHTVRSQAFLFIETPRFKFF